MLTTGTVGVLAVERGIELRIEEKVAKGDFEALGEAARMLVSTWQALAGIVLHLRRTGPDPHPHPSRGVWEQDHRVKSENEGSTA